MPSDPSDGHDRLIHAIYDAAEEPDGFQDVLVRIGRVLGAPFGHTLVIPFGAARAENHAFGNDASAFEDYDRHWRDKDPRFAASMANPGKLLSDVTVIDADEFERSALYNEVLAPVDVRYTMFGNFMPAPDLVVASAFMRVRKTGPFGPDEIARFSAYVPHLTRAIRLRHVVGSLRSDVDDLRRALDATSTPVAILDRSGKVLCANALAEALVAKGDGLCTHHGKLTASVPGEARAIDASITKALLMAEGTTGRAPRPELAPNVTISRADGVPVAVTLLPLRPRSAVRDGARDARVLAIFHDPSRLVRIDPALAAKLHGLTATEAALAAALAEGKTLADFAEDRGCSEQTARTHLKRILEKTRTKRQPDLVRVLITGAASHHLGEGMQ